MKISELFKQAEAIMLEKLSTLQLRSFYQTQGSPDFGPCSALMNKFLEAGIAISNYMSGLVSPQVPSNRLIRSEFTLSGVKTSQSYKVSTH